MIILKAKTFGTRDPEKILNGVLKGYMRDEDRKQHGRPSREESRQNRIKRRIQELNNRIQNADSEIEYIKKEEALKKKLEELGNLKNPTPPSPPSDNRSKTEKLRDKVVGKTKEITSNPKFKKNAKIAGLATLGTGLTAGAIVGGVKLKKKIDEKRDNEKIKKSISEDQKK